MTWLSTRRSLGAIVLGGALFVGAICILFWRFIAAWSLQGFSQFQLYTLMSLGIAYASGHFMVSSAKKTVAGVLFPIGFACLFAVATWVCVSLSGASTSESFAMNESSALAENAKIERHKAKIAEANAERARAKEALDAAETTAALRDAEAATECASGVKLRCEGRRSTAAAAKAEVERKQIQSRQADNDYWVLLAELDRFSMPKVANVQLRQVAKAIAFAGYDENRVLEGLLLYLPYAFALLTEAGSILSFAYGFGARTNVIVVTPANLAGVVKEMGQAAQAAATDLARSVAFLPSAASMESKPSQPRKLEIVRKARTSDEQHVLDALDKAGRPLSCEELAEAMSVSPSESTKRRQVCEASGVVKTQRVGKYLMVSPAVA